MKMDRYAAYILTFLYLQSLCFVRVASLPTKNLVDPAGLLVDNRRPRLVGEGGANDDNFPRPTQATCVAGFKNRSDQVYGIYARMSTWGHEHIRSDSYSEAAIQVSNDQGGQFSAIRAGFHTYPGLYNDTKLHMFAQWTVDRDWTSGCYNTDCPGFVPFKTNFGWLPQPGMVVDKVSSYNKTDASMILQIVKDERPGIGGDWWLYRVSWPARFPLGYWPASLFADSATEAAWYGAVGFAARGTETPAMGSGHDPRERGPSKAAYFAEISLMDRTAEPVEDPRFDGLLPMVNYKQCFQVVMDGNAFFYGGPVRSSC